MSFVDLLKAKTPEDRQIAEQALREKGEALPFAGEHVIDFLDSGAALLNGHVPDSLQANKPARMGERDVGE